MLTCPPPGGRPSEFSTEAQSGHPESDGRSRLPQGTDTHALRPDASRLQPRPSGPRRDSLETGRRLQRNQGKEEIHKPMASGQPAVHVAAIETVPRALLAEAKRETSADDRPCWQEPTQPHVPAEMHVMVSVDPLGLHAVDAPVLLELRGHDVRERVNYPGWNMTCASRCDCRKHASRCWRSRSSREPPGPENGVVKFRRRPELDPALVRHRRCPLRILHEHHRADRGHGPDLGTLERPVRGQPAPVPSRRRSRSGGRCPSARRAPLALPAPFRGRCPSALGRIPFGCVARPSVVHRGAPRPIC